MVAGAENGSRIFFAPPLWLNRQKKSAGFRTLSERVEGAYNDAMASLMRWQVHAGFLVVGVMQ